MRADDLSLLRFKDPILPAFRGLRPVSRVLPVQQHDVKVLGLRECAAVRRTWPADQCPRGT